MAKTEKENLMAISSKPVPEGFHTVTPSLIVRGAADAIEFYKKAFGAQELMRMAAPEGRIGHAELKIGDSIIFLADEFPNMGSKSPQTLGGSTGTLNIYVKDVDTTFQQAIAAGGKATMPVADMFWGDRYGSFVDPFGHSWGVGTHKEDLTPQQIDERAKEFYASMAAKKTA
jgi:PhnB protein